MNNDNLIHPLLHSLEGVNGKKEYLSKSPCDCCGSRAIGTRHPAEAVRHDDSLKGSGIALLIKHNYVPFMVCSGCMEEWV
jgi:hypothetical protein